MPLSTSLNLVVIVVEVAACYVSTTTSCAPVRTDPGKLAKIHLE